MVTGFMRWWRERHGDRIDDLFVGVVRLQARQS
jgi:hypothetical protein